MQVVLTALRSNEPSLRFFKSLDFDEDETCPDESETPHYLILSKRVRPASNTHSWLYASELHPQLLLTAWEPSISYSFHIFYAQLYFSIPSVKIYAFIYFPFQLCINFILRLNFQLPDGVFYWGTFSFAHLLLVELLFFHVTYPFKNEEKHLKVIRKSIIQIKIEKAISLFQ